jgi:hypothetical protein
LAVSGAAAETKWVPGKAPLAADVELLRENARDTLSESAPRRGRVEFGGTEISRLAGSRGDAAV